jgi:hypothetical protein
VPRWEVPGWRERFGISAGITGRGEDPADPFDLGLWTSQPVAKVMERWRQFRSTFPPDSSFVMAHQVHGTAVRWHDRAPASGGWTILEGLDGHATDTPGLILLVTVADCVPVYVAAPEHGVVALLHAGWRGTAGRILEQGIQRIREACGANADETVMHCGVAISGPCYEVGSEVTSAVGIPTTAPAKQHLDLRSILAEQGRQLGIGEVTVSGHCTAVESRSFFSHRRSGGSDGRMIAWLGIER